ncbi:MAG: hypothetical protein LBO74_17105 [Candidatus Symbiothrix sp.]|jgi:hypothetical protein|nr:hypothetical protein [Candidatus Symbiothrix sp.]
MKQFFVIVIGCIFFLGNLQATPYFKEEGLLDKIGITYLDDQGTYAECYIFMRQKDGCTANYESRYDALAMDNEIWTLSANDRPLFRDQRPYSDYFTDIPLRISVKKTGNQHTLKYSIPEEGGISASIATAIELRKLDDDTFSHNFFTDGDYTFEATSTGTISTYYIRVWGANVALNDTGWNNVDSWLSGKCPSNKSYVFIPEDVQFTVASGSYEVDTIDNEGTLIIDTSTVLTVEQTLNKGTIHNFGILNSKGVEIF